LSGCSGEIPYCGIGQGTSGREANDEERLNVNGGRRGVTSREVECFPRTDVVGAHRFVEGRIGD
jgi:hypothetical protein